jgi:hypothetical protein
MNMSYQDHFKVCSYCNKGLKSKPTITVKSASSYDKRRKLIELGHMIKGIPTLTKGASYKGANYSKVNTPWPLEKAYKLKELAKMIKGL